MKKQLLFLFFCVSMTLTGWAQSISFTSVPTSTQVGTNLVLNYNYTAPTAGGKVAVFISKNGGVNPWDYISAVIYAESTPTVAGTDVTGTFTLAIPVGITPTASLTGNQNYRIKIELFDASNNWLAGDYSVENYNFTAPAVAVPAISITSIPTSAQVGTNLVVDYKYTALSAGGKVAILVSKNGGANPWDYISTIGYDELTPTIAGTDVTGSFTLAIPGDTTPTASLTGNENYRIQIELLNSSNTWLAGNYDNTNYNFTAAPVTPAISFTSVPTSTEVGTNLAVNYKYTAPSTGGKVAIVITKNGGVNPWDYISTVVYDELTPTVAGTDVTGTFTLAIPAETTPTSGLTGNENYSMKIELLDSSNNWLAGNYDYINYNFTAVPLTPAISFTSVPSSTQVGTNLVVNYKYTAPSAGGKVVINISKNGGTNPWDYISNVYYDELTPTVAGTDVTGTFTLAIPAETPPTASLTGNENYRIKIELLDSGSNFSAGNYDYINYNFTAATYNYYVDADGDNYGAGIIVALTSPIAPSGYSVNNTDCDDSKSSVYPSATEIYDGIDNDCDGSIDEGATLPLTLTFCKGSATVTIAKGTTDLQLYTSPTSAALVGTTVLTSKVYYATLNGSARTAVTVTVNPLPTEVLGALTSTTSGTTLGSFAPATLKAGQYVGTTIPISYRIPAFTGAGLSYLWSVPTGVSIVGSADTNILTVHYNNVASGIGTIGAITVQAVNSNGCAGTAKKVTVSKVLPTAPGSIKMTNDALPLPLSGVRPAITTFAPYMGTTTELTLTAKPSTTATSYVWELPTGVNVTNASATTVEGVTSSTSNVITVNFAGVTSGNTYNYSTTATVPVSTNVARIGVKARNGVGVSVTPNTKLLDPITTSTARLLTLKATLPAAPAALKMYNLAASSTVAITDISTYINTDTELTLIATASKLASSYSWEIPSSVTIVAGSVLTSNSIKVTFKNVPAATASLYLGVKAVNGIGSSVTVNAATPTSTAKLLKVSATAPSTPTVAGNLKICSLAATNVVYTIATVASKATSYFITLPVGATIGGNATATIPAVANATFTVNYASGFIANTTTSMKSITVASVNGFGSNVNSRVLKLTNTGATCPPAKLSDSSANDFSVKAYPNPSSSEFNIETSAKGAVSVKVYDMQGRLVEKANTDKVGSRLAAGAYNVIVNQGANTKSVRVIKK